MGSGNSQSLKMKMTNKTKNITLMNPRTYFGLGHCSKPPLPELSPGSRDTCRFSGDPLFQGLAGTTGVSGILVYEAESFTLAIYFHNPVDHNQSSMEMGLELSPGKAHLSNMATIYLRMAHGTYSNSCQDIKFARITVGGSHGSTQLSHGPIRVLAAMSFDTKSTLKVVLEEEEESGEEAEAENPQDVEGDGSGRSESMQELLWDMMDSPGSSWRA